MCPYNDIDIKKSTKDNITINTNNKIKKEIQRQILIIILKILTQEIYILVKMITMINK